MYDTLTIVLYFSASKNDEMNRVQHHKKLEVMEYFLCPYSRVVAGGETNQHSNGPETDLVTSTDYREELDLAQEMKVRIGQGTSNEE